MAKYKVVFVKKECIGALACVAVHGARWIPTDDGKVDMKDSKLEGEDHVLWIDEKELSKMKEAAESCPVNVIHIYDEKGTKIV
ncbi:MAG: ferredoxin [Nanoarchaeota archaeon]|nr:ferredoxin [Nanoarchaeota archaeon]